MSSNPLSPAAVLQQMANALPTHSREDPTSYLSSSHEVVALLCHASMLSLRFRLLGFDEDNRIEQECASTAPRLPAAWNSSTKSISFVYAHKQSSMTFVVCVDRMGGKLQFRGLAIGDEHIYSFDKVARECVNSTALPLKPARKDDGDEDRSDLPARIKAAFASEDALQSLLDQFKVTIIQKLIPKLQIEGYEESPEDVDARQQALEEARGQAGEGALRFPPPPHPFHPFDGPRMPRPSPGPSPVGDFPPPRFEDEYEMLNPPRGALPGGSSPFNIGHDDLNPPGLGPRDPLRPSIGPGLRPGGGMGMHPIFDDPLFAEQGRGGDDGSDLTRPPGARYDPVGPLGPRFPGRGFGGGGRFGGGFGPGDII